MCVCVCLQLINGFSSVHACATIFILFIYITSLIIIVKFYLLLDLYYDFFPPAKLPLPSQLTPPFLSNELVSLTAVPGVFVCTEEGKEKVLMEAAESDFIEFVGRAEDSLSDR